MNACFNFRLNLFTRLTSTVRRVKQTEKGVTSVMIIILKLIELKCVWNVRFVNESRVTTDDFAPN